MLGALMSRLSSLRVLILLAIVPAAVAASGCGSGGGALQGGVKIAKSDPLYEGAKIFNQRCGGCHTLEAAGTEGSATQINSREYKDGPNFNVRKEEYPDVLYAIRNGGFSSGPMPQNIVTGRQAELVACFLATNSGKQAARLPTPGKAPVEGAGNDNCKQQFASK
jgi:mono/diheme cytochrome c family protein